MIPAVTIDDPHVARIAAECISKIKNSHQNASEWTLADKIGAIILSAVVVHNTTDQDLIGLLLITTSVIGSTTGLRPPKRSTMELLQQLN